MILSRTHIPTRVLVGLGTVILAAIALTGCSKGSVTDSGLPAPGKAKNLPAPTPLSSHGPVVPVGTWAVVQTDDDSDKPHVSTIAIKAGVVRKGSKSDLKNVQVMNGDGSEKDLIPYYVNYYWSVLDGAKSASPVQNVYAIDSKTKETGEPLSVPKELEKCTKQITDYDQYKYGVNNVDCLVVLFRPGSQPDTFVFDGNSADFKGTSTIDLAIPAK